jgi:hypothetical protein
MARLLARSPAMGLGQQDDPNPFRTPNVAKAIHLFSNIETFGPFRSDDDPSSIICEFQSHYCAASQIIAGTASQWRAADPEINTWR